MNNELLAITLGLSSALTWGAGDFSGGIATKRGGVLPVILLSQAIGGLLLTIWGIAGQEIVPGPEFIIWGAIAGICGTMGLTALYSALARGKMGIVAPLSAVVTAIIPVIFGLFLEGMPAVNQLIGFCIAILAIWFLSFSGETFKTDKSELGLALLAGIGFGLFFICIDQASTEAVIWPLFSARFTSIILLLCFLLARKQSCTPSRRQLPFVILAGVFDTAGNVLFVLASQLGRLDVSAVLASLYPASTIMLAWILLKERLRPRQWVGVVTTISALVLISL